MIRVSQLRNSFANVFLIFISLAGTAFLAFLTQVVLSKILTVEAFGTVTTALSYVTIMASLLGFGLPSFWLLCFGESGWGAFIWVRQSFRLVILLVPIVVGGYLAVTLFVITDVSLKNVLFWMLPLVLMQVLFDMQGARLQLEGRYKVLSLWQTIPHVSRLIIALTMYLKAESDVLLVAQGYGLFSCVMIFVAVYSLLSLRVDKLKLVGHGERPVIIDDTPSIKITNVVKRAWPFAATAGFVLLYGRIEIVVLGSTGRLENAAVFGVAVAFLLVAFLAPQALFQKYLLPKIHRWYHHDKKMFVDVYKFNCAIMGVSGVLLTLVMYFASEIVVTLIFGEKYSESSWVLSALSICILIRFLSTSIGSALISGNNMKRKVYCQAIVAVISVTVAAYGIINYGLMGAVVSKIITELSLLTLYLYTSIKYVLGRDAWSGWTLKVKV